MLRELCKTIPGLRKVVRPKVRNSSRRSFLLKMLPKGSVGAEIGVHKGEFSESLFAIVKPKELHLIDPWKHQSSTTYENAWYGGAAKNGQSEMDERYSSVCSKFESEIRANKVKIHRGDSADVLAQFPDNYFDWVYIDGNHLYEYVKTDIQLSFSKTRVGGYITGDDYTAGGWWKGGVKKAVDEFAAAESAQLVGIRDGQFVFRKSSQDESLARSN